MQHQRRQRRSYVLSLQILDWQNKLSQTTVCLPASNLRNFFSRMAYNKHKQHHTILHQTENLKVQFQNSMNKMGNEKGTFNQKLQSREVFWFNNQLCTSWVKGYLRCETILCHNVALDVQLMNLFIWRKNIVLFPRYQDFCVFKKPIDFKICDVTISIAA